MLGILTSTAKGHRGLVVCVPGELSRKENRQQQQVPPNLPFIRLTMCQVCVRLPGDSNEPELRGSSLVQLMVGEER